MNKKKKDTPKYLFIEHSETVTFLLICTKSIKLNNYVMKKCCKNFIVMFFICFIKIFTHIHGVHILLVKLIILQYIQMLLY